MIMYEIADYNNLKRTSIYFAIINYVITRRYL